jgi:predicted dienelactone hydrolase
LPNGRPASVSRRFKIPDSVNGGTIHGFVFHRPSGITPTGSYQVTATADAPPSLGTKPLVVISHGGGGSNLGHHSLATYLARLH